MISLLILQLFIMEQWYLKKKISQLSWLERPTTFRCILFKYFCIFIGILLSCVEMCECSAVALVFKIWHWWTTGKDLRRHLVVKCPLVLVILLLKEFVVFCQMALWLCIALPIEESGDFSLEHVPKGIVKFEEAYVGPLIYTICSKG